MSLRNLALCLLSALLVSAALAAPDLVKRGGAITLKVDSFGDFQKSLYKIVETHRGTIGDRRSETEEKGQKSGWVRVVVPKAELDSFLADIRPLGKVYGEQSSLKNYAQEFQDLGQRSKRLEEHQQRLTHVLSLKSMRGSDILFVQERLLRSGVDSDSLIAQRDSLAKVAEVSSVIVTAFEPSLVRSQPSTPLGHISRAFTNAFQNIARNLLNSLESIIGLLIDLIGAAILWLIFRKPIRKVYDRYKPNLPTWKNSDPSEPKAD